ncbi:MAG: cob(I)yrinic acid a,c-diamide adenosyltransferase [Lachnospiraceae bacterium]|nr:cob(I)yrinic acid a,c-diamide adenosyltransferase [Lachnospiraceae bacterium]
MENSNDSVVQVYYGKGQGKTSAAVGQCIRAASKGYSVIIIQFLKGKDTDEFSFLAQLEPQIKLFSFERETENFDELTPGKQKEETLNILNGFNFAKKVINSMECDVLVLDEVLGLIDLEIITIDDIISLINTRNYRRLVITGQRLPEEIHDVADVISKINLEKDTTV